jgi:hypothetical protein
MEDILFEVLVWENIFSEIVVYFQKSYPNINGIFTCASIFEKLSSPSNHITPQNQLVQVTRE